jgi:hypothetical protein
MDLRSFVVAAAFSVIALQIGMTVHMAILRKGADRKFERKARRVGC